MGSSRTVSLTSRCCDPSTPTEGAQLQCSQKLPCGPQGLPRHTSWAVTSFPAGSGQRLSHHGRSGTATCRDMPSRQKALSSSPVLSPRLHMVTHSTEPADVPNVAQSLTTALTTAPAATVYHHGILHVRPRLHSEPKSSRKVSCLVFPAVGQRGPSAFQDVRGRLEFSGSSEEGGDHHGQSS